MFVKPKITWFVKHERDVCVIQWKYKGIREMSALSSGAQFYFKPAEGEHIGTAVTLEREKAAAICGTVKNRGGNVVCGALILLFTAENEKRLIDRQFTDDEGQFYFGPIEGNVLYKIKAYKNDVKLRELEIVAE